MSSLLPTPFPQLRSMIAIINSGLAQSSALIMSNVKVNAPQGVEERV